MVLTESMMRAIHADRVRDIERATREHRLVESGREEAASAAASRPSPVSATDPVRRGATRLPA
jgi:hypothetical protein